MNYETATRLTNGKWHSILQHVGVDGKYLTGKHCPCPICGGTDRFRFDDKQGNGGWICSNCGAGNGFSLISKVKNTSASETLKLIEPLIPSAQIKAHVNKPAFDGRVQAERFWKSTVAVMEGSPVWNYLTNRLCGFYASPAIREGHTTHPEGDYRSYFVMAAKISDVNGRGVSVHKTYLLTNGEPAGFSRNKLITAGTIPAGSAIRLTDPAESMGIAEGIETAMSANILTGIPTWSAISAPILKQFQPPKICKFLTIFADNDINFTGQSASYELARRLKMTNPEMRIEVRIPPKVGDWNDILREKRNDQRI